MAVDTEPVRIQRKPRASDEIHQIEGSAVDVPADIGRVRALQLPRSADVDGGDT